MARMARVVAAGVPHHITQRGNNRQDIFLLDDDRRFYLDTLRERSQRYGVTLLGYCLMTNHVHLVAIPERPDSLARALGQSHSRYAQRFNRRYGRSGHLWQNRFYSCPLGRTHLVRALLYADLNPVRAGLVGRAEGFEGFEGVRGTGFEGRGSRGFEGVRGVRGGSRGSRGSRVRGTVTLTPQKYL